MITSLQSRYLCAVLGSGGLSTSHRTILGNKNRDYCTRHDLIRARLLVVEHGRIYATAAGCVEFGPEVANVLGL